MAKRWIAVAGVLLAAAPGAARGEPPAADAAGGLSLDFGLELKAHYRDSERNRFPVNFPLLPGGQPPAESRVLETVEAGTHVELSTVTLRLDAARGERLAAHAKLDFVDRYDRNPTSTDREWDVDEAWLRLGREAETATVSGRRGAYVKLGKFGKFERQDDRHLESYGLAATAFNRFEDTGVEVGVDLGHLYLKGAATQGNPVFLRDPNALAGDHGTPALLRSPPDPELASGIVIPYDAEVEDPDLGGDLELGAGVGLRLGDSAGRLGLDLLAWSYGRRLAETVALEGTFYGGDLDLLDGPFGRTPPPALAGDEKREVGANLWLYAGGFSLFVQLVDQELAGLERTGAEAEVAWAFELPLVGAVAGRQLFPFVAPAVRWSRLDPDFRNHPLTPAPSFAWEWEKLDAGVRLGLVQGIAELTVEYADNSFVLGSGAEASNDELLTTLRWRL
ncbi:MAG TPA: hypothetical protein VF121_20060 [Thermoanaerobaculia bacterium]|nr:hypothetical protein [Thermoanaerobaculia bacterium]